MPNAFDSYIAKQCGYALHLDSLTASVQPTPSATDSESKDLRARHSKEFRSNIGRILAGHYPKMVQIGSDNSVAQTTEAMDSGAPLIWKAHLPEDLVNQRTGRPNLLVRFGDEPQDGTWRYVPVIVERHKTHKKQVSGINSLILGSLDSLVINEGEVVNAAPEKPTDVIKLAHYWSMLETLDRVPQGMAPTGGIVGHADLEPQLIWITFELTKYQKQFNQALAIINHAQTVTADPLLNTTAQSIRVESLCKECQWEKTCSQQWEKNDSIELAVPPSVGKDFRAEGITTRRALADMDYTQFPSDAKRRIKAVLDARAQLDDRFVVLPTAINEDNRIRNFDIEIDVDMENTEDHCYIWGTYTTIHGDSAPEGLTQGYRPFAVFESDGQTFAQANAENEAKAFASFWQWAQQLISECEQLGVSIGFYFYTKAENTWLAKSSKRYAGELDIPSIEEVLNFVARDYWIDIAKFVERTWATGKGYSLKVVAKHCGHEWEGEDDNGASSQVWFDKAIHSPDSALRLELSQKLLTYNENDVVATKVIREYLRNNWPFDEVEPPTLP